MGDQTDQTTIMYTQTDEAPALATRSFLPMIRGVLKSAGVSVELKDISLAGRLLAAFRERLPPEQQVSDALAELGALAKTPEANIIKLPNISASVPQMVAAIRELQAKGFDLPDYPEAPDSDEARAVKARYDKVKGSAVNPVLREGNSDRRAPRAVKEHARAHPPRMRPWHADVRSHVATMKKGDFRANEKSVTLDGPERARIEFVSASGEVTPLREDLSLLAGEVLDASFMSRRALTEFLAQEMKDAKDSGLLFSIHLKATMMKVSDPIIFGHAVRTYFASVFDRHGAALERVGASANNGLRDLLEKLKDLSADERTVIESDIEAALRDGPSLAMVDSDKGITNLHVPNDIIIDASMPPLVRDGGCMWNREGALQETKAVIPDSSYATAYAEVLESCKKHGAFDPKTMGSVSNVGLMAQKAEEYGSHDKTFEVPGDGVVRIVTEGGRELLRHEVEAGDIWRACQTKHEPICDWVRLAVRRARATETPAVFWLDAERAHDAELIQKVQAELGRQDTSGLEIHIMAPAAAMRFSIDRIREGKDSISVTGNVLRDYLTDLFPILEVGTSAKMLSIVPLMNGGGLFETGAGGSAPKHVQQLVAEGHLRWDSLGEFLALAVSLAHVGERFDNAVALRLGAALDDATTRYLMENRAPSRKVGEIDNRGSHYYLLRYWAEALAAQSEDTGLAERFGPVARALADAEASILSELRAAEGQAVDLGGYFLPDDEKADQAMRPSATLNAIVDAL